MADIIPKEVFETINNSVNEGIRSRFGPPDKAPKQMPAAIAVALMQLSLRYFAETGAPKEVVRDFFEKLVDGDGPRSGPAIKQDGNRLILLPGEGRVRR